MCPDPATVQGVPQGFPLGREGPSKEGTHVGTRAAIFVQRGALDGKQQKVCLEYIDRQHWSMLHVVPYWAPEDAVSLVRDGTVDVIVTAFDSQAARALAADLGPHGRVLFVHPAPTVIEITARLRVASLVDLILRWRSKGRTIEEIAEDIDGETTDVRAILRRAGEQ